MGPLESGLPLKRDFHFLRISSSLRDNRNKNNGFNSSKINGVLGHRSTTRFSRIGLFKKIDFLQLISGVAVFFFFAFIFQSFCLPGSVTEDGAKSDRDFSLEENLGDLPFLKELDFGEDLNFEPLRIMDKFKKGADLARESAGSNRGVRFGYRKPKLALVFELVPLDLELYYNESIVRTCLQVFSDLQIDQHQILMVTVASALLEIGYEIEVFSQEKGPAHAAWRDIGVPTSVIIPDDNMMCGVDWLNYEGVLVNSLNAVGFVSCLMQEPFKNVPLVWTIHEQILAARLRQYASSGHSELVDTWKNIFSRATVVVFPNYILPMAYSMCDSGNYFVIPGSPEDSWKADKQMTPVNDNPRQQMGYGPDDFVIALLGSQLSYRGMWLEHAILLRALRPLLKEFNDLRFRLRIMVSAGYSTGNYSKIVETIALQLGYPNETVSYVVLNENPDPMIRSADIVVYGSFLKEPSYPDILLKAMCLGKLIIAPDLPAIRKYVSDKVNGYLFPKEDMRILTQIMSQVVTNGKISLPAQNVASFGKVTAKNLMASESLLGYASLLENILDLPSEVALPKPAVNISVKLKAGWQWQRFEAIVGIGKSLYEGGAHILDKVEKQFNRSNGESFTDLAGTNDTSLSGIWEEQKYMDMITMKMRKEDEELKDRTDQPRGTWDDVYRNARRAYRSLHERDEGELERMGQPLCIYEPYSGVGTWPFLHRTSLYRGLALSPKVHRHATDDVDGPSRLPLLSNSYYRDLLEDYGAFFAIANRVDNIHKNAWIGFQSWRATARMKSLSKTAEKSLLDAIETRRHGDTLYFWGALDVDPRNPLKQDFWSFCDAVNAGNCQFVFSKTLKQMYGVKHNLSSLPAMPSEGGTWSVMHSWVLPTKSFMEFVMFSRMFVDALDAQFYDDHQNNGQCYLSLSKDKHCYSRLLELLVNVWAYHSARRIVHVDPETGFMQEQHNLNIRKGQMWVKWFQLTTLKAMDEDLAEEFDSDDRPKIRRLWPSTGEIFYQAIYEKERNSRNIEKEKKRQQNKDKIQRIRKRTRQRALGKYVKPSTKTLASKL